MEYVRTFNFTNLVNDIPSVYKDKCRYLNSSNSFDIETTSFTKNDNKYATMYIWGFNINGTRLYGRTWSDLKFLLIKLKEIYGLSENKKMIIYVHNLAYEFQFMRKWFNITAIFARKERHPIKIEIENCFIFKCSYFLSGLSLEKTAENLTSIKINKLKGDLDYSLPRHSKTKITSKEMEYLKHDIDIVYYYIKEEIKKNKNKITEIPLTKTGYVRRYCRNYIKHKTNYKAYRNDIMLEAPYNSELFILMNKAFAGGYTHANYMFIDMVVDNVVSIDFTSSYPTQMIAHKYPRSKFIKKESPSLELFKRCINTYACIIELTISDLIPLTTHSILSRNKCIILDRTDLQVDNGRLRYCKKLKTYITDVDFKILLQFYTFNIISIDKLYCSVYDYLPKPLIECVLNFYKDKTILKGVIGKEEEYLVSKGMLNGIYGMCVTNPVNDDITYLNNTWSKIRPDITEALKNTYDNNNTFLCYQWGVWVTAWARYELLMQVSSINEDVIYCDTDSIKFINYNKHQNSINNQNHNIIQNLEKTLKRFNIDTSFLTPCDIYGKKHTLGVWDYEGCYDKFKTLGAKRYCYEKFYKPLNRKYFQITISGIPNKILTNNEIDEFTPTNYIIKHGKFDYFQDGMKIPEEYSCKLTHTYIDEEFSTTLIDYNGVENEVFEKSYIHLSPQPYEMNFAKEFILFLLGRKDDLTTRTKRDELAITVIDKENFNE